MLLPIIITSMVYCCCKPKPVTQDTPTRNNCQHKCSNSGNNWFPTKVTWLGKASHHRQLAVSTAAEQNPDAIIGKLKLRPLLDVNFTSFLHNILSRRTHSEYMVTTTFAEMLLFTCNHSSITCFRGTKSCTIIILQTSYLAWAEKRSLPVTSPWHGSAAWNHLNTDRHEKKECEIGTGGSHLICICMSSASANQQSA